jgi:hypothetical protein
VLGSPRRPAPMTTVVVLPRMRHVQTRGDAAMWLQPRRDHNGTRPVLVFTTSDGRHFAVALSRDELVNLREGSAAILSASTSTVETWLDQAAAQLLRAKAEQWGMAS